MTPEPYINLGLALRAQGKLDEAVAEYRVAIRLNPDDVLGPLQPRRRPEIAGELRRRDRRLPRSRSGSSPMTTGPTSTSATPCIPRGSWTRRSTYRVAIRLEPEQYVAHYYLASALCFQGKFDEAIAECRVAIRLMPDHAPAYEKLGLTLGYRGKYEEGLVALRRALELAPPGSITARDVPGCIQILERLIPLAGRLPAVLKGADTPRIAVEGLDFSRLCQDRGWHAAAARLYAAALTLEPGPTRSSSATNRYWVACSAALAGCGKCQDDPPPDETARAALRQQALDWLKAERAYWARQLESGTPQARRTTVRQLRYWQQDTNLAGVRDELALARLPERERTDWRDFWSDVETLRKEASGERR